jgi:hypothetical protein
MQSVFLREIATAGLPPGPGSETTVTAAELDPLPEVVRRYFYAMGAVGRPRIWSFRLAFNGRFRLGESGEWMDCHGWQYNTALDPARYFKMRVRYFGLIPVVVHDTYLKGHGGLQAKLMDLVPVANGKGPEFDLGELVTYLDDALLFAPSLLLGPQTSWSAISPTCFDAALSDKGNKVTARVFLDQQDLPSDVSTDDRFFIDSANSNNPIRRERWHTPVAGWATVDGRKVVASAQAIWQLPAGPLPYIEMQVEPGSLVFNALPAG